MKFARKVVVTLAATAVSIGIVSISSAPAHADTAWPYKVIVKANK